MDGASPSLPRVLFLGKRTRGKDRTNKRGDPWMAPRHPCRGYFFLEKGHMVRIESRLNTRIFYANIASVRIGAGMLNRLGARSMIIRYAAFFVVCTVAMGCSTTTNQSVPKVESKSNAASVKAVAKKATVSKAAESSVLSKSQAEARLAKGATLFDARSADEFATGHLGSAINVPYELLKPTLPALESYKDKEILVVGKDREQVEAMRKDLSGAGFRHVLNAFSLNS